MKRNGMKKSVVLLLAALTVCGVPAVFAADAPAKGNEVKKVDFVRPSGWGGRSQFVKGRGQKYLSLTGDPAQPHNDMYYTFYHMSRLNLNLQGGDQITFKVSCKLEKLTAGKFQVGVYEFSDPKGKKSIRFQSVEVPVSSGWQTLAKTITLHPDTQSTRFYVVGRNAGKGDTLLVRSLEFEMPSAGAESK